MLYDIPEVKTCMNQCTESLRLVQQCLKKDTTPGPVFANIFDPVDGLKLSLHLL